MPEFDYLSGGEKPVIQRRMDQLKGELKAATDLDGLAERLENAFLDQVTKAEQQSPKSGAAFSAAWTKGLNELQQAFGTFEGTQGFGSTPNVPGSIGQPTQLEAYEQKHGEAAKAVWGKETKAEASPSPDKGSTPKEDTNSTEHTGCDALSAYGHAHAQESRQQSTVHGPPGGQKYEVIASQVADPSKLRKQESTIHGKQEENKSMQPQTNIHATGEGQQAHAEESHNQSTVHGSPQSAFEGKEAAAKEDAAKEQQSASDSESEQQGRGH